MLYALNQGGTGSGNVLYTIDVSTGETTDLGTLWGDRSYATSIDFDSEGNLYAINSSGTGGSGEELLTINTSTFPGVLSSGDLPPGVVDISLDCVIVWTGILQRLARKEQRMRSTHWSLGWVVLVLVAQLPAAAQTSTEDCVGQPSLGWQDMLPFTEGPTPVSDDFAMTGAGCSPWDPTNCGFNDGFDRVVCFTPTNDCEVLVQVATGNSGASAHVFSGACGEPASCVASLSEDDNAVLIPSVDLAAGTQYCFVAERCGSAAISLTINHIDSTCGPLGPVPLFEDGFESGDTSAWSP